MVDVTRNLLTALVGRLQIFCPWRLIIVSDQQPCQHFASPRFILIQSRRQLRPVITGIPSSNSTWSAGISVQGISWHLLENSLMVRSPYKWWWSVVVFTNALTAIFEYKTILSRKLHTKMLDQRDRHVPWSNKQTNNIDLMCYQLPVIKCNNKL